MQENNKNKLTMDILSNLDISNLKERRAENANAVSILDPEEPGITPEEAKRRRAAILMAPPEELMRMEMEQRKSSIGKPNPLELPLDKLK